MPGTGLSSTSSLCPDNIGPRAQVVAVQVSLFLKIIFREPGIYGKHNSSPTVLEGKQDASSEVHGSWTPGQGERWPPHPREAAPRDTEGPAPARGSGKRATASLLRGSSAVT